MSIYVIEKNDETVTMRHLDTKKWHAERMATEQEIEKMKEIVHRPGAFPSSAQWGKLYNLQAYATDLYMLRAELRNRLHTDRLVEYVHNPNNWGTSMRVEREVTREAQRERVDYLMKSMTRDRTYCERDIPPVTEPVTFFGRILKSLFSRG